MFNVDDLDKEAVWSIASGLLVTAALLFILTRVLKFRFVLGVGD